MATSTHVSGEAANTPHDVDDMRHTTRHIAIAAACLGILACGTEEPQDTARRSLEASGSGIGKLDPDDPRGFEQCWLYHPMCSVMCVPLQVDPGVPGTCCVGDFNSSCGDSGHFLPGDRDQDGVVDPADNCVFDPNPNQSNQDSDTLGDACDNCDTVTNQDQTNTDRDTLGDACDPDDDNDGILDDDDSCPRVADSGVDFDGDGVDDACLSLIHI